MTEKELEEIVKRFRPGKETLSEKQTILSLIDEIRRLSPFELHIREKNTRILELEKMVEEAREWFQAISDMGPADFAKDGPQIACNAIGTARMALRELREPYKKNCLHGGVFRGEKCGTCGEEVR
jgi:hypothetical protein